jgi:hypothetical protein
MLKALKGNFITQSSAGDTGQTFAIIQTFRGGVEAVSLDVFFSNNGVFEVDGVNVLNDLAPGAFKTYQFVPDWSSERNLIDQGYAYLKSLPEFENATDVI